MRFTFQGETHDIYPSDFEELDPEWRAQAAAEATFLLPDGSPMEGQILERARLFFARDVPHPPPPDRATKWLIPGLMPNGTVPMLGGNPKAGKSLLTIDLTASLLTPGRRFLNHFEPVNLSADSRHGDNLYVMLINAENPVGDYEDALREAGVPDSDWLKVIHLDQRGGAGSFDITDPIKFELWARELIECDMCDGTDFYAPSIVIVDGLTAILHEVGKGPDEYGVWGAAFQRLLRASDVPNGLVVAHNTLKGNHLMGGVEAQAGWDGLWNYSSSDPDNPNSPRFFSVVPRLGGVAVPRSRVVLEEGRLALKVPEGEQKAGTVKAPSDRLAAHKAAVIEALTKAGDEGLMTTEVTGRGRVGTVRKEAMTALADAGVITSKPDGLGARWFLGEPTALPTTA